MKKIYFLLLAALPFFAAKAQTCYIDHSSHHQGIWPDSATNFISGTVGVPYTQNVTLRIPLDTTASGFHCTYSKMVLSNTNWNLPPGLSLTGTPSNYNFPGNDSSCMLIYGTPTTAGTYTLNFVIKVYCTQLPFTALTSYTVSYYKITINAASGIENRNGYGFELAQNSPNPVATTTNIKYTAAAEAKMKLSVYNITGQKIIEKDLQAQRGENNYVFDASPLESGVYIYALELNGQRQVRRMVVSK
ncbi:MAG: T9SS type A sorting domain-containing protein [Bacteroidetes bacterium]|nr:T9SS type A sorting domain-containing protein [Bacteroidota bacterium]